jgi:hypothetical protein
MEQMAREMALLAESIAEIDEALLFAIDISQIPRWDADLAAGIKGLHSLRRRLNQERARRQAPPEPEPSSEPESDTTDKSSSWMHLPPSREYVLEAIREGGATAVYGATWPHDDAATIAKIETLTDRDWAAQFGCDHCDDSGNCLGHGPEGS